MKNALLFIATIIFFVSCKNELPIVPPAPSTISIGGVITNEDGMLLESILAMVDTNSFDMKKCWIEGDGYTDQNGFFLIEYMPFEQIEWPKEVTVTAIDTSGIYAAETQTFEVAILAVDSSLLSKYHGAVARRVVANFVLSYSH